MARICLLAFIAVCSLTVLVTADPAHNARGHQRFGALHHRGFHGAHTADVPVYAAPEPEEQPAEAEEPAEDEPAEDEPQEQPEQDEEPELARATPKHEGGHHGGATAIANSVSRGDGATSESRAAAHHGHFKNVNFKHH